MFIGAPEFLFQLETLSLFAPQCDGYFAVFLIR